MSPDNIHKLMGFYMEVLRVRTLCGYTVVVESGFARQLLDVLPWHRLMKVAVQHLSEE